MVKCNAPGCSTNESTKINGKSFTLFSFPTDNELLLRQWEEKSTVKRESNQNFEDLKLCELHFKTEDFTSPEKNALVSTAIPTVFEFNNKRQLNDEENLDTLIGNPPLKRAKSEPVEQKLQNETNLLKNPLVQRTSEAAETKEPNVPLPENMTEEVVHNGLKTKEPSLFTKQIDTGRKVYRLIIRIDKVTSKTDSKEPRVTKLTKQSEPVKLSKTLNTVASNGSIAKPCSKIGCKFIKTMVNSKPMFQCERCSKCYVVKKNRDEINTWSCYICHEVLLNQELLRYHILKHFTCDMCQSQCNTQNSYDKHVKLHVSTDPLLPYKCHKCSSIFEDKAGVRQHWADKHLKIQKYGKVEEMIASNHFNKQSSSQTIHESSNKNSKKPDKSKIYTCTLCPDMFNSHSQLYKHIMSHLEQMHGEDGDDMVFDGLDELLESDEDVI